VSDVLDEAVLGGSYEAHKAGDASALQLHTDRSNRH
jgi:hypothetical protein